MKLVTLSILKRLGRLIKVLLIIKLPFFLLIRGSVYLHSQLDVWPWFSLAGGIVLSTALLIWYGVYVLRLFGINWHHPCALRRLSSVAVSASVLFCYYAIFYLSIAFMPNELLKEEIRDIHPVLRLSISTLGVLDKGLTVVDASRVPSDYKRMGRHVKAFSLHYKQSNGYAHALDIRTIGHSEWRNFLIIQYFKVLGFNTLRHSVSGPSGDHLHVSLISHDRPRFY